MSGIIELDTLLQSMSPELQEGDYVFCTVKGTLLQYAHMNPLATFQEKEGLTLLLPRNEADTHNISYEGWFKLITLLVHSSLDAVGLTAAVATQLTRYGISANVVAAYYHDHIFVPHDKAELAMEALVELTT